MSDNNITVMVSAQTISRRADWLAFCRLRGINELAMNEGMLDPDEKFELSLEECRVIGMSLVIEP